MTLSLNPVALKEIRQLVRSRLITLALVLYPVLLLAVTILTLSASTHGETPSEIVFGRGHGEPPFIACSIVTGLVACAAIPLFAAIKTVLETGKDRTPLEFTTTLTPAQIVGGKMTAAAILMAALIAVSMPFFTLAYLMRGLSLAQTFLMPCALFAAGLGVFSLALPIATSRTITVPGRIIILILLMIFLPMFGSLVSALTFSSHYGSSTSANLLDTIRTFVLSGLGLVSVVVLSRALCAAQLSPPFIDAERPLRKAIVILQPLTALVIPLAYEPWTLFWLAVGAALLLRSAFNPHPLPRAACKAAPRSFLARLVSYPFATDACSGLTLGIAVNAIAAIPILFDEPESAGKLALAVVEVSGLLILANGFLRASKAGPRGYRIGGIVTVSYIALANFANVLSEADAVPEALAQSLPCNLYGISEMTEGHAVIAVLFLLVAGPVLLIGNIRSFRKYRRD